MSRKFSSAKEVEQYYLQQGLSKNFCSVPFSTLLFEPDGSVGACRHKGCEFPVGNIFHQTFDEIWNGAFLKNWRQEFIDGTPKVCKTEVKDKKCNQCQDYAEIIDSVDIAIVQKKKPQRIAFNFNGKCNLECKMCHVWQKPNGLYDKHGLWAQLDDWIEDLKEVELLSGEPFIQKDTYRLIDHISSKRPAAKWIITTNANWQMNDFIKTALDKIVLKNLIVSLDSLSKETYEAIRKKGDHQQALRTIQDLVAYNSERLEKNLQPFKIRVNFLFQKDNWRELGQIEEFEKKYQVQAFRTFLYEPFDLSLLSLPMMERLHILEWYLENLSFSQKAHSWRILKPLIDSLDRIEKVAFYDRWQTKDSASLGIESPL